MGLWSAVRWVRAASFAATCAVLAAGGHLAGGGHVHRLALIAGFLAVLAPALALTRRERTIATILPAVAVCQVVLHVVLSQASAGHTMPHTGPAGEATMAMAGAHGGSSGTGMLLMHAVAVLVTSWWLECGEARLCGQMRRLARWALRPFARIWTVPVHGPARPTCPRRRAGRPFRTVLLRYALARRGPPGSAAALG
ncbi:hypothetical protein AGRA3207_001757 [Actinomadura graeca]|uniref:MFS transporter n=1 Tax=Actinomadura graeca TaxID=2750812 RepID=A0ABX8QQN5_9ACTN|nr:hypothetical protein [Actinomadura graeca]QXJ20955.1 hypothetical protein AGRA3207_001757 [Actinomadura graeca]